MSQNYCLEKPDRMKLYVQLVLEFVVGDKVYRLRQIECYLLGQQQISSDRAGQCQRVVSLDTIVLVVIQLWYYILIRSFYIL